MARGFCSECDRYSTDISYPSGFRCPACRERLAREREDERRRRDFEVQQARLRTADFARRDRVFDAAARRLDPDDEGSVWNMIGVALQRGRPDYAERLLRHAREKGWDVRGWEKMIPDRLNPR